jgi:hypothetical protein
MGQLLMGEDGEDRVIEEELVESDCSSGEDLIEDEVPAAHD